MGYYAIATEPKPSCQSDRSNPCDVISGRKTQQETDLTVGDIELKRYYDSGAINPGATIGSHWRHAFDGMVDDERSASYANFFPVNITSGVSRSRIHRTPQAACQRGWGELKNQYKRGIFKTATAIYLENGTCAISSPQGPITYLTIRPANGYSYPNTHNSEKTFHSVTLANGAYYTFKKNAQNTLVEINNNPIRLSRVGEAWEVEYNHIVDTYSSGDLLTRKLANGRLLSMEYNETGMLSFVRDQAGNWIQFHYNDHLGQVEKVTFQGGEIAYQYDEKHNLIGITYPDNTTKQYHYDNTQYQHLLTGITDEGGNRYATWAYDDQGRAILSEHADGAERVEFAYNNDGTTTVTDANGAQRTYHFVIAHNALKVSHITGDQCSTCPNGHIQAYTYNADGFIATETDWAGQITQYTRDPKGRELSRTEAYGLPEARTITTVWNTDINRPLEITYPHHKEVFTYNDQGHLIKKEQLPVNP